jgi:hypothetical protein
MNELNLEKFNPTKTELLTLAEESRIGNESEIIRGNSLEELLGILTPPRDNINK